MGHGETFRPVSEMLTKVRIVTVELYRLYQPVNTTICVPVQMIGAHNVTNVTENSCNCRSGICQPYQNDTLLYGDAAAEWRLVKGKCKCFSFYLHSE